MCHFISREGGDGDKHCCDVTTEVAQARQTKSLLAVNCCARKCRRKWQASGRWAQKQVRCKSTKRSWGGGGGLVSRIWLVFGSVFRFPHSKPEVFRFFFFARFADFLPI